jgi:hypothetical protein
MGEAAAHPDSLTAQLIAPCGMDCGVCIGHLRERRTCPGCNHPDDSSKANHCVACRIKNCEHLAQGAGAFCGDCATYPCARLRQLDKRYRSKYRMSMLENLGELRSVGVEAFVELERARWTCPHCGALASVHRTDCLACGGSVEDTHGAGLRSGS